MVYPVGAVPGAVHVFASQQVPSGSAPGGVACAAPMSFEPAAQAWSFAVTSLLVHMGSSQHAVMSPPTVRSQNAPAQVEPALAVL